jgi:succinate dehydrogenase / fumarate reductase cytochrome b subunit
MMQKPIKKRPKNLNLMTIRLPINAVVSILHRVSGIGLFLLLPALLWCFSLSLKSAAGYQYLVEGLDFWLVKLLLIATSWAFFHHFFAGIRHLLQDVHWMTSLQKARFSGRVVLWLVGFSVLVFAIWMFS